MIKLIEKLSMNAWPALESHLYDGWILGISEGYTRRANSVCSIGDSTLPIDKKIKYCEDFYKKDNLPVIFKIVEDNMHRPLDNELHMRGYDKIAQTSVRIKNLSGSNFADNSNVIVEHSPSDKWIDTCFEIADKNTDLKCIYSSILRKIKNKGIWATYKENGKNVGFGFAVIEKNYCGIFNLHIANEFRRKGYAKAIMDKLLFESQKLGVTMSYLQVEKENSPAEMLYGKLGYREIYRYFYRKLG